MRPDVRALSFAVHLPPGVLGPGESRHDFSMNNASTFPLNDAHAFATFMRVVSADGRAAMARTLLSMSFRDIGGFMATAVRGVRQQRQRTIGDPAMPEGTPPPPETSPRPARREGYLAAARRNIGNITLRTMVRSLLLVALLAVVFVAALSLATIIYTSNYGGMLPPEPAHEVVYLDQGWGSGRDAADRQTYYYTPQGAA